MAMYLYWSVDAFILQKLVWYTNLLLLYDAIPINQSPSYNVALSEDNMGCLVCTDLQVIAMGSWLLTIHSKSHGL